MPMTLKPCSLQLLRAPLEALPFFRLDTRRDGKRRYPRLDDRHKPNACDPCRFLTFALSVPSSASNFALIVDGLLLFNNDSSKWPGSVPCLNFLGGSNIALAGSGVVDGNGAAWWSNRAAFRPGLVTSGKVAS